MSTPSDRVICPRCGVNNFSTQAACWKCGTPLAGGAPAGAAPRTPGPPPTRPTVFPATPGAAPSSPLTAPAVPLPAVSADPGIAVVSAIALAFLFPFVAVPVGLVFLMLDDRRKIQIGKITLVWGLIFFLLQAVPAIWLFAEARSQLMGFLPGRSQPRADSPVPEPQFPGMSP